MNPIPGSDKFTRRRFLETSAVAAASVCGAAVISRAANDPKASTTPAVSDAGDPWHRPLLTCADDFYDVSRGSPKPFTLTGDARVKARLTPEDWRLEIVADPFTDEHVRQPAQVARQFRVADGTALDLNALTDLAKTHGVRYLKAMQCLNISEPLGQGLWEGVPLRELLRLCGPLSNVRRIYYWGFHNNDPKQLFQSSLSYTQAMETPPGELPAFVAFRLNGEPIPLKRGGPVRMIVPWAHGFKSIKWLQSIALTNDYRANDTYALQNNDPESHLKTAAYIDSAPHEFKAGKPIRISGLVMSGLSGLSRVEYWLRPVDADSKPISLDDPAYASAQWLPCRLQPPPTDWSTILPPGVSTREILGFDKKTGEPLVWPLRYSVIGWTIVLPDLEPGKYEFRARAVDLNDISQPDPRPILKSGKNAVEMHTFEVTAKLL